MKGGTVHQKEQIRFIRKNETKKPPTIYRCERPVETNRLNEALHDS
ncbi:hypothetical protein [Lacrimispora xylanisolvens]